MFTAFARAFGQLSDPPIRRLIGWSVAASSLALVLAVTALSWALGRAELFATGWLNGLIQIVGTLGAVVVGWLMLPALVLAVSGLFLDQVVGAVERRWYPDLPASMPVPLLTDLRSSLGIALVALLLNLLALPLYLLLPGVNLLLYYALNGYLLGRQYFEMVSLRHLSRDESLRLRAALSVKLFWAGVAFAFLSSIPFVNLVLPVIATATMVHLFAAAALLPSKGLRVNRAP
jgi:CysZ protein